LRVGLYIPAIDTPYIGGPTKYQINLAEALAELDEIELFLLHHRDVRRLNINAEHIVLKDRKPISWELKLRKVNLDIIHFNVIFAIRRIFFPILNCKKVITVHGDEHWIRKIFANYDQLNYRIRRLMEPLLCRHADKIIAVSNDLRNRLVQFLKLPESKIEVVHEGVSSIYKPIHDSGSIKEKYSISRPFVFHVSNLSPKKNPKILLKTFGEVIKKNFDLDLVIAGARWTNKHVKSMIKKLDLASNVKILGYVPEQDLVCLYSAAELFFSPTLHETFGFPVLEAMACGIPVVASNAYSIPEVAGNAAILCDPHDYNSFADNIIRVLENPKLREKMRVNGLKNANFFSWERCAKQTTKIFKQILMQ
jgi:glycosyltransferase involved in cell wall biosynthesis